MVKSIYRRMYESLLNDLIEEFKESINKETPTEFVSLQDIFKSDPKAKQIKDYLLKCSVEHCPEMNPLFIDIFLAIYYNTNEPIDGNLLRMTLGFKINDKKECIPTIDHPQLGNGCLTCRPYIEILKKAKKNIDYCSLYTVVCGTIELCDLTIPCYRDTSNNTYSTIIRRKYPTENVAITLYAVRPEFIKFALNNIDLVCDGQTKQYFSKYVEYYEYLENCIHPDKLGTVNFIIEPKVMSPIELLTEKINELLTKIDGYNESNTINDSRLKYLLSLIK